MKREEKVMAVQRMQDYIKNHMTEAITLKALADCAGYSPFHCSRIFKELTGKSPFDYIRALRLSQAALKLRDEEKVKVVDVSTSRTSTGVPTPSVTFFAMVRL